jgi:Rhomboid-like protein
MSAITAPPQRAARRGHRRIRSRRSRSAFARNAAQLLPWPTATPLATAMVLLLLATALLLRTHPADIGTVVAWASTNQHNLAHHPAAAMLASMFVVTGSLLPELLVVAIGFAVLERAIGPFRTAVIALTGQIVATLLTEYGAELGARLHLLAASSAERPDVGVSYVMYAVLAASVLLLAGRARLVGLLAVGGCVLVPFLVAPGLTSTGHVLAVAVGAATMALIQRRARHQRMRTTAPAAIADC